jgi:hypothetical protein
VSGNGNTAIGPGSLAFNTTGSSNTALGLYSLYQNSTGSNNVAIGFTSLEGNTSGGGFSRNGVGVFEKKVKVSRCSGFVWPTEK